MSGYWIDRTLMQYPESTKDVLYIIDDGENSVDDLFERIKDHFGEDVNLSTLKLESENIQLRHFNYDLYDPLDWQRYIVIRKENE